MLLSSLKEQHQGIILELPSNKSSAKRLRALGIRKKANFKVVSNQNQGIVINLNNNRIALDSNIASDIKVSA